MPPIVGINFGNSYASIAVLVKEGVAECIANEDGERQIACAIAFQGEEMYIGNSAKHQLVKNSQNTITGFRNLLGKKFSEVPQATLSVSAPVIQHPTFPDTPAYKVKVLQPAPSPLPVTATNTPAASQVATPRSEPVEVERFLTVSEVVTIFLGSLLKSAEDFLGHQVVGAVISVPPWFDDIQRNTLTESRRRCWNPRPPATGRRWGCCRLRLHSVLTDVPIDRTQLVVDLGASSLELSLLSIREGFSSFEFGGDEIDSKLIKYFAKEFTKKTKTPLTTNAAEAKLRLAVEHTKRTLSASPGAATCSTIPGSINRLRFDLEVRSIYDKVYDKVKELVARAEMDLFDIDEVVYIGGSACLPGLDETLSQGFAESVITPFKAGTVVGGGGCALQAQLLFTLSRQSADLLNVFNRGSELTSTTATSRTIGLLVPQEEAEGNMGGVWMPLVLKETPLPCRRTLSFEVDVAESDSKVGFEVWEVKEGVKVDLHPLPRLEDEEPNEDDEEFEEVKQKTLSKEAYLSSLTLSPQHVVKGKTKVQVQVKISSSGDVGLSLREVLVGGFGEACHCYNFCASNL
ncbi:hypothetical protein EDD16DRAFT_1886119 [Pisolithus croceorrhizus]|nr:hypothetical protein EDD16DRAFT_1886119 [Pisolithus croceorrhizus]